MLTVVKPVVKQVWVLQASEKALGFAAKTFSRPRFASSGMFLESEALKIFDVFCLYWLG